MGGYWEEERLQNRPQRKGAVCVLVLYVKLVRGQEVLACARVATVIAVHACVYSSRIPEEGTALCIDLAKFVNRK